MGFLSGIFGNQNVTETTYQPAKGASQEVDISKMQPGQTVSGRVVSSDENGVTLRLKDGGTLNAKLDGSMNLSPGQMVSFSVKGNSDMQLTLSPLYTNLAQDQTAAKALTLAGIPISDASLAMTNAMISSGMGIDKSALLSMFQQVGSYPSADPKLLVQMMRYGLEINENNIQNFSAFQNYENQITEGMNEILEGANQLYQELMAQGNESDAAKFMNELIKTFLPQQDAGSEAAAAGAEAAGADGSAFAGAVDGQLMTGTQQADGQPIDGMQQQVDVLTGKAAQEGAAEGADKAAASENMAGDKLLDAVAENNRQAADEALRNLTGKGGASILEKAGEKTDGQQAAAEAKNIWQEIPFGARAAFVQQLKEAGMPPQMEARLLSEDSTSTDFLKQVQTLLEKDGMTEPLKAVLNHKNFPEILKEHMKEQWTLRPEDTSKTTVENLYRNLNEQVRSLTETLTAIAKPDSSMGQSLSNMNQNLDFMNQMNQMYQYVQLPMRMNGMETTGDLFVYTDKKSLAQKDGDVSALLHLDMANLGPLDVYASLHGDKNVSTRFYLQDDETLQFIADHIHILNERLEGKGYNVQSRMVRKGESEERPEPGKMPAPIQPEGKPLAHYGFNVLA